MRRSALLAITLIAVSISSHAETPSPTTLLGDAAWLNLRVVLGRIEVGSLRRNQNGSITRGDADGDHFERLSINADTEIPSIRYDRRTPDQLLHVQITNGRRVEINATDRTSDEAVQLQLTQAANGRIVLATTTDSTQTRYTSRTLWHLLVEHPDVTKKYVVPILESLEPQWRLGQTVQRAEDELLRLADPNEFNTKAAARRYIAQLDSARFRRRNEADRNLRSLGIAVVPYLDSLDPSELSPEQRSRLSRIRVSYKASVPDTPERIAAWLVEDKHIWLALLSHDDAPVRAAAAQHLAKLHSDAQRFDPRGSEEQRQQQIARLRSRLRRR